MPKVFQLGYVELGVGNIEATSRHYTNVLGMSVVEAGNGNTAYLSLGQDHHNIALVASAQRGVRLIGLQLIPGITPKDLQAELSDLGLCSTVKTDARPGVAELLEVEAPGNSIVQLYTEMTMPNPGFEKSGVAPVKLGHTTFANREAAKVLKFYTEALGFYKTDWYGDMITFLSCNQDHHVVSYVNAPFDKLHHIAFELRDNTQHFVIADQMMKKDVKLEWGPSRHPQGHNIAAYHYDPDRMLIEFYTEMDQYMPAVNQFQPRPWHDRSPLVPKDWAVFGPPKISLWNTEFAFSIPAA